MVSTGKGGVNILEAGNSFVAHENHIQTHTPAVTHKRKQENLQQLAQDVCYWHNNSLRWSSHDPATHAPTNKSFHCNTDGIYYVYNMSTASKNVCKHLTPCKPEAASAWIRPADAV